MITEKDFPFLHPDRFLHESSKISCTSHSTDRTENLVWFLVHGCFKPDQTKKDPRQK
jgi:hypothetical protein